MSLPIARLGFKAYEFWYHSLIGFPGYERAGVPKNKQGRNLKILFDFFHVQSMTGNLLNTLKECIDLIGHVHIAGVPGQHDPADGEIEFPLVLGKVLEMG